MPDLKKMLTLEALSEALPSWLKRSTKPEYNADEIDSTLTTNQFVTASDKDNWNAKGTYSKPSGGIPKSDLSSIVQTSLEKADSALQSETDPTVPSWAKQTNKPSYTQDEVSDGTTYKRVTQTEKDAWSGKQNALTTTQMQAVNSGITSAWVTQISTNQTNVLYVLGKTGKNLADPKLFIDGGYISNSSGAVQPSETLSYMDYLDVNPNTEYYITTQAGNNWGAWYDANKNFISGLSSYGVKTSPANAKYLRCTLNGSYATTFMVCTKADYDVSSAYESFKGKQNYDLTRLEAEDRAALAEEIDAGAKNVYTVDKATINNLTESNGVYTQINNDTKTYLQFGVWTRPSATGTRTTVIVPRDVTTNGNLTFEITKTSSWSYLDFGHNGGTTGSTIIFDASALKNGVTYVLSLTVTNCVQASGKYSWKDVMICTLADWKVSQKFVPYDTRQWQYVEKAFASTAADTYEYSGVSFTVPANQIYEFHVADRKEGAATSGILIADNKNNVVLPAEKTTIAENAQEYTTDILRVWMRQVSGMTGKYHTDLTYYVWVKRAAAASNVIMLAYRRIY